MEVTKEVKDAMIRYLLGMATPVEQEALEDRYAAEPQVFEQLVAVCVSCDAWRIPSQPETFTKREATRKCCARFLRNHECIPFVCSIRSKRNGASFSRR